MTTLTLRDIAGVALTYSQLDNNFKLETNPKSADYTTLKSDNRSTIEYTGTGGHTVTLPTAATILSLVDTADYQVVIKNSSNSGIVYVAAASGDTIDSVSAVRSIPPQGSLLLKVGSVSTNW